MNFFLRTASVVLPLLFCFFENFADGLSYEDRGKQVIAQVKSSWQPKINKRFVGHDENVMAKFTGVKPDFATHTAKNRTKPHHSGSSEKPRAAPPKGKGQGKGGRRHGNHTWNGTHTGEGQPQGPWKGQGQGKGNPNNRFLQERFRLKRQQTLPVNFDWRDHTSCDSFDQIRYQTCGDCWAVSSAAAMSDRFCLYTYRNKYFSAKQISSCVYGTDGGCEGGYPQDVGQFYLTTPVATGGDPTVPEQPSGCLRYPNQNSDYIRCPTVCDNGAALDGTRGGNWRSFHNEQAIMNEIYIYGSVVACFEVFQDFGYMGAGVYQHVTGGSQGWHAVRLIGWGVDQNGVKYWQAANQWGTDWGDEGFFKILRGSNHCGIESYAVGVYPIEAWYQ